MKLKLANVTIMHLFVFFRISQISLFLSYPNFRAQGKHLGSIHSSSDLLSSNNLSSMDALLYYKMPSKWFSRPLLRFRRLSIVPFCVWFVFLCLFF